ncbi:DUF2017 family protein [Timonella sp. A28]|uniref:DUF2017 family protein n=1 Tax=Timonella sp. A28 TaxID=3442640 RepID=UPI003EB79A6D
MARPFGASPFEDGNFIAYLTTGERLFLVRAAADVVELLGEEDGVGHGSEFNDEPENSEYSSYDSHDAASSVINHEEFSRDQDAETIAENLERLLSALNNYDEPYIPTDPAIRRLLPDASLDAEIAAEFRKFTDFDLREQKVQRLLMFSALLTDVDPSRDDDEHLEFVVPGENTEAIAGALGDIRIVLGERLDLKTDGDSEDLHDFVVGIQQDLMTGALDEEDMSDDDERRYIMGILFELAGFLQESLVGCMLDEMRSRPPQK